MAGKIKEVFIMFNVKENFNSELLDRFYGSGDMRSVYSMPRAVSG